MPVRKTLFTDYSTPERAALRRRNENLMAEAKSQDLPVPPTPDEATLQAELDETDKRLEQLERELNKLIKSESEDDAERLRADLKECRNKKLELERELGKCRRLHSETDRRLQRLEEAFFNFVQSDSVDDAERLSADLRECTQKRNELEQQLRQCRNPGGMDFLSPEESAEFERDRRQAFQQADFKPVSELDLSNAPEPVYDDELLKKYENSEKQLKFCKNQLELCKLQEVALVAENKQLTSNVEQQGIQINFYLKALEKNREEQAQRNVAEPSNKGELTSKIALLELTNATQNAELARGAAEIANLRSKLEVLQETNNRQEEKIAQWTYSAAQLQSANSVLERANETLQSKEQQLNGRLRALQATSTAAEVTQGELIRKQNDLDDCEQEKQNLQTNVFQLAAANDQLRAAENDLEQRNNVLIQTTDRIKKKLQSRAVEVSDLKESISNIEQTNTDLEEQVRKLNLPVAREIPADFYQLETSRADAVRDYILARVKWWVLEPSETNRITEITSIFERFADVPDLFPWDQTVLTRYRVELVRLLKNKWEEVTNKEWAEEDTGVWGTLAGYISTPNPIPTIRKILEEFQKIGVDRKSVV